MTTLEILRAARELLSDESRWCRHGLARDAQGDAVAIDSDEAVSFSIFGATARVSMDDDASDDTEADSALCEELPEHYDHSLYVFSRSATHAEVMELFSRAIAKLEAEGV